MSSTSSSLRTYTMWKKSGKKYSGMIFWKKDFFYLWNLSIHRSILCCITIINVVNTYKITVYFWQLDCTNSKKKLIFLKKTYTWFFRKFYQLKKNLGPFFNSCSLNIPIIIRCVTFSTQFSRPKSAEKVGNDWTSRRRMIIIEPGDVVRNRKTGQCPRSFRSKICVFWDLSFCFKILTRSPHTWSYRGWLGFLLCPILYLSSQFLRVK